MGRSQKHWSCRALLLLPFCFMLGCVLPFIDRSGGHPQLNNVAWKNKNIIIILGMRSEKAGTEFVLPKFAKARVFEAIRLYRDCKAIKSICLILASGGDPASQGVTEAELMRKELLKNQIPQEDLILEDKSISTFHNAQYTSQILMKASPDLTILVSSDAHLPRALKMFKLFGIIPLPAPAEPFEDGTLRNPNEISIRPINPH